MKKILLLLPLTLLMFSCSTTKEEAPAAKPKLKVTLFSDVVADGTLSFKAMGPAGAIDMTQITSPFKVWWINTDGDYMFSDVVLSK